jgi:hypothetical protein
MQPKLLSLYVFILFNSDRRDIFLSSFKDGMMKHNLIQIIKQFKNSFI